MSHSLKEGTWKMEKYSLAAGKKKKRKPEDNLKS